MGPANKRLAVFAGRTAMMEAIVPFDYTLEEAAALTAPRRTKSVVGNKEKCRDRPRNRTIVRNHSVREARKLLSLFLIGR